MDYSVLQSPKVTLLVLMRGRAFAVRRVDGRCVVRVLRGGQ